MLVFHCPVCLKDLGTTLVRATSAARGLIILRGASLPLEKGKFSTENFTLLTSASCPGAGEPGPPDWPGPVHHREKHPH